MATGPTGLTFDFRKKGESGGVKPIVWTASDFTEEVANAEFPYIQLIEYEQTYSALLAQINFWMQKVKDATNPYYGLYLGTPTKNEYFLPFYMDIHHQIGQNWQENSAPLGVAAAQVQNWVEMVAKAYFPSAGIVHPKSWAGSNPYAFDVRFELLNTVSEAGITFNKLFLETLIRQTLHVQHNALTITPPCLYEVYIPGIRWSPVAVISNLTITNRGTLNRGVNPLFGNYIVPDAWEVHMQIMELINESRNIYDDIFVSAKAGEAQIPGRVAPGKGGIRDMNVRVIDTDSSLVKTLAAGEEFVQSQINSGATKAEAIQSAAARFGKVLSQTIENRLGVNIPGF